MEALIRAYRQAGLNTEILNAPLGRVNNADIFLLGIESRRGRPIERFQLWPGHRDNRVAVQNIDKELQQVLLYVCEPARVFEERIRASRFDAKRLAAQPGFIGMEDDFAIIRRTTPAATRHFLTGMDERHYFICQLPQPATTVRQAHQILRPAAIRRAAVVRQGEWFFRELDAATRDLVETMARSGRWPVRRKVSLATLHGLRDGNPHVSDEGIAAPGLPRGTVYIRGRVRHVDHKTVRFSSWVQVFRNAEAAPEKDRVQWVD